MTFEEWARKRLGSYSIHTQQWYAADVAWRDARSAALEQAANVALLKCDELALDQTVHDYGNRVAAAIRALK